MQLDIAAFRAFCRQLTIPSKDHGHVPFVWWGTQEYEVQQIAAGLERGIHDHIILKGGRQIGGSTLSDALDLYWPQANQGTQGMVVCDEDESSDYRRDLLLEMQESLPREYKLRVAVNNRGMLRWPQWSRLMFKSAGKRSGSMKLGRGRGVNYLHADEVGEWPNLRAISSLRNALSEKNPNRLYIWNSTAQGLNTPFRELWDTAQKVPNQQAIFVAWWRHHDYALAKPTKGCEPLVRQLWNAYATEAPNEDERLRISTIKKRYGVTITKGQLGWWRWKLDASQHGDETMMMQEFGWLPEECFQAFGDKFISPAMIRKLRMEAEEGPAPECYEYKWGPTLDAVQVVSVAA